MLVRYGRDDATYEQLGINTPEARQVLHIRASFSAVYSAYWLANVLYFAQEGGYEAIRTRVRLASLERNDPARRILPLEALKTYLEIVSRSLPVLTTELGKSMGELLRDFTFSYMSSLSDDELKGEDRKTTHEINTLLEELMAGLGASASAISEAIDRHTLGVALKCFRSPYLLKRLQGLQELKDAITTATRRDLDSPVPRPLPPVPGAAPAAQAVAEQPITRAAWLQRWMRENGVLEELFGKNAHPNVVRACSDLVRFIAGDAHHLEPAQLDLIWAATAQHELRAPVYDVVAELGSFLCADDVGALYEKIRAIPLAAYDPLTITLLRNFSSNAVVTIHGHVSYTQSQPQQEAPPKNVQTFMADKSHYGLAELWAAAQDEAGLPLDIAVGALTALQQVLEWFPPTLPYAIALRLAYAVHALDNVAKSRSVPPSLRILRQIAVIWRTRRLMGGEVSAQDLIDWLEKHHALVHTFLDDLARYKQRVAEARAAPGANVPAELNTAVFVGKQTHHEHYAERLEFIEFVVTRGTPTLGRTEMQRLWTAYVDQAVSVEERDAFLRWLESAQTRACHGLQVGWSDEVASFLFEECIARLDFSLLTPSAMAAFEFFLRYVNWRAAVLDRPPEPPIGDSRASQSCYVTDLTALRGGDLVWRAVLEAHDPAVGTTAINLLHALQRGDQAHRTDMYLARCFKEINEANAALLRASDVHAQPVQLQRIDRCLTLLRLLLDDHVSANPGSQVASAAGAGVAREEEALAQVRLSVSVMLGPKFELEMRGSDTAAALAAELSKRTGIALGQLRMIALGRELKPTLETLYSQNLHVVSPQALFVTRKPATEAAAAATPVAPADSGPAAENAPAPGAAAPPAAPAQPPSTVTMLSTTYFDDLFRLLSLETLPGAASVVERAWGMVMLAPMNPRMVARVAALGGADNVPVAPEAWDEVLDARTSFRLLYALNVLSALLRTEDSATVAGVSIRGDWPACFAKRGGPERLGRVLLSLDFSPASLTAKRLQCLSLLLAILRRFLLAPGATPAAPPVLVSPPVVKPADLIVRSVELSAAAARAQALSDPAALPAELKIVAHSIQLISAAAAADRAAALQLLQANQVGTVRWLECVLTSSWETARAEAQEGLTAFAKHLLTAHPSDQLHLTLLQCLFLVLPSLDAERSRAVALNYFDLVADLLAAFVPPRSAVQALGHAQPAAAQFMEAVLARLEAHPVVESDGTAEDRPDNVLAGLLRVATLLASRFASFKSSAGPRLLDITHNALFAIPSAENHGTRAPPKCKSKATRTGAFKLLSELAADDWANFNLIVQRLVGLHGKDERRTWSYSPTYLEKAACGFVGLKNQGATCYMNSLMQQLYAVPSFRYGMLQLRPLPPKEPADDKAAAPAAPAPAPAQQPPPITPQQLEAVLTGQDSIVFQLQNIFANLQESSLRYYDTRPFCNAYREPSGAPMNVEVQMDADEFFSMLVDRLERQLRGTSGEALLKELFGGTISHQIISRECAHGSEREETFYTLGLEVKNKKTLAESLDLFVQADSLEGDNKWMCEVCGRKVAALKRAAIKSLPNTLIVGLKRFEFDFETMRRVKVNDLFEFPPRFSAQPWTCEGLQRRESKDKDPKTLLPLQDDDAYEYELVGVLVHTGTADSGHYYSFIKERAAQQWFIFNDTHVEPFDERNLPAQCYGGQETNSTWDATLNRYVMRPGLRPYSAYMLFYQRRYRPVAPNAADWLPPLAPLPATEAAKLVPRRVYEDIWTRNAQYHSDRALFAPEYHSFVIDFLRTGLTAGERQPGAAANEISTQCIELGIRFACETLFHARERVVAPGLLDLLRPALLTNVRASSLFLDALTARAAHWLRGYTLECDVEETRVAFFSLVSAALSAVRPGPGAAEAMAVDGEAGPQALSLRLLEALWGAMPTITTHWRVFEQYFHLIEEIARLGGAERHWLLAHNAVTELVELLLGEEAPRVKAGTIKKPTKMGDKCVFTLASIPSPTRDTHATHRWASPNLVHVVNIISLLVRSTSPVATPTPSPSLLRPAYPAGLAPAELDLVRSSQYLTAALREGGVLCVPDMQEMVAHLSWESAAGSEVLLGALCAGLNTVDYPRFRPFFYVINRILSLDDSLTATRPPFFLTEFIKVIDGNLKYRNATAESLRFIARLLRDPKASVAQATQARMLQTTGEWLESWLLRHLSGLVRDAAALIVEALVPSMPSFDSIVISRAPLAMLPDDTTEDGALRQMQIHSLLLGLLPAAKAAAPLANPAGKADEDVNQGWNLVSWLRLLRTHLRTPAGRDSVHQAAAGFADLWLTLDAMRMGSDLNKREMLRTLHFFFAGSPENVAALVRSPELCTALMENHVVLKSGSEAHLYYHQIALHYQWDILRGAALADAEVMNQLLAHRLTGWYWRQMVLISSEYPRVAPLIEAVVHPLLSRPDVRRRAIMWCLDPDIARSHPNAANHHKFLATLQSLLTTPEDQALYFEEGRGLQQLTRLFDVLADLPRVTPQQVGPAVELLRIGMQSVERSPGLEEAWDNRGDMAKAFCSLAASGAFDIANTENLRLLALFLPAALDNTITEPLWSMLFTPAQPLPQGPQLEAAQAALLSVCSERSPKKNQKGIGARVQLSQGASSTHTYRATLPV